MRFCALQIRIWLHNINSSIKNRIKRNTLEQLVFKLIHNYGSVFIDGKCKEEFKTDEYAFESWSIRNVKNSIGSHSLNKKELYSVSSARIWKTTVTMTINGVVLLKKRKKKRKKIKINRKLFIEILGFIFAWLILCRLWKIVCIVSL